MAPSSREEALALLDAHHTFPGPFHFRVVIQAGHGEAVAHATRQALGPDAEVAIRERPSRKGNYESVRVTAHVPSSEAVLDVYDHLGRLDCTITLL